MITNYTHHKDLLKALKGGKGVVTRWWTKVFRAPKVVIYYTLFDHIHENTIDRQRSMYIPLMKDYMEFAMNPTTVYAITARLLHIPSVVVVNYPSLYRTHDPRTSLQYQSWCPSCRRVWTRWGIDRVHEHPHVLSS